MDSKRRRIGGKTLDNLSSLYANRFTFRPDQTDRTGQYLRIDNVNGDVTTDVGSGGGGGDPWEDASSIIEVHPSYSNTGSFYSTVSAALTHAVTLSPTGLNPVRIEVQAGVYFEPGQLDIPEYVYVRGVGRQEAVLILVAPLAAGESFVHITFFNSGFNGCLINANGLADIGIHFDSPTGTLAGVIYRELIVLGASHTGVLIEEPGNQVFLFFVNVIVDLPTLVYGFHIRNNALVGFDTCSTVDQLATYTSTGMFFENTFLIGTDFRNNIFSSGCIGCGVGFLIDNSNVYHFGGDIVLNNVSVRCINGSQYVNTNCSIRAITTIIENDATSNVFSGNILTNIEQLMLNTNANLSLQYIEENVDNFIGSHQVGDFANGDKLIPSTAFFGQGAQNFVNVSYLRENAGPTYTDITSTLKPSDPSATTLFNGSFLYVGDVVPFYTLETTCTIATTDPIVFEYWDGALWQPFNVQVTDSVKPYGSYQNIAFSVVGTQDIRFDIRLSSTAFNWTTTTIDGMDKYWIRLSRTSATVNPQLSQMLILYNTTKIDDEGVILRFGNGRTYKSIIYDINLVRGVSGSTAPTDTDLWFGEFSRLGRTGNSLNTNDNFGFSFFAPTDCDSSCPFKVYIAYLSSTNAINQDPFNVTVTVGNVEVNDAVYYTQATANGNIIRDQVQFTTGLPLNATDGSLLQIQEIDVPIPFIKSRNAQGILSDLFHVDIVRTADTNGNNLVFAQIVVLYASFLDGTSIA